MRIAITRAVPATIPECELTYLERAPIDVARAVEQHAAYEAALEAVGCVIERLPPADDLPDSVFVEDAAIVFDEVAIVTRPGAPSRRRETASVAGELSKHRPLLFIDEPATLDGGDVLRVGRRVYVGVSSRTNHDGVNQLRSLLVPFDYSVEAIDVAGCLHLKSAASEIDDDLLLVNPEWVDIRRFGGLRLIDVHPAEPHAANVLRIDELVICAAASPMTRNTLEANGFATMAVDVSELAKAEAGVTCCSLIVRSTISAS